MSQFTYQNHLDVDIHHKETYKLLQHFQYKNAFAFILWGLALMMLQFQNFIQYSFFVPAIGIGLLFMGSIKLSGENQAMYNCFRLSVATLFFYPVYVLVINSPLVLFKWIPIACQIILLVLEFLYLILFRSGLKGMVQSANSKVVGDPVIFLLIWLILEQVAAYTGAATSLTIWVAFVAVFVVLAWIVWIHSTTLEKDGYVLKTRPTVVSTGWLVGGYGFINLLAFIGGTLCTMSILNMFF